MGASMTATADTRYSFTAQHLAGAALMTRHARGIEGTYPSDIPDDDRIAHRAYMVSIVMQCAAALESEVAEICMHGPGHHLGSDHVDRAGQAFLAPLADVIDGESTLERYELVLHLLRKEALDRGTEPWRSALLLVRLRNEIVHYKSRWGREMSAEKLWTGLKGLHLSAPPFNDSSMNFFPHQCLSAAYGKWAVETATKFIDAVYERLGVPSPLDAYRARLAL